MKSLHTIFDSMLAQGWTIVAATGDGGATAYCDGTLRVQYPGSDPDVVGVGGTKLYESNPVDSYEVAWTGGTATGDCKNNNGGSTGGFSEYSSFVADYQSFL